LNGSSREEAISPVKIRNRCAGFRQKKKRKGVEQGGDRKKKRKGNGNRRKNCAFWRTQPFFSQCTTGKKKLGEKEEGSLGKGAKENGKKREVKKRGWHTRVSIPRDLSLELNACVRGSLEGNHLGEGKERCRK